LQRHSKSFFLSLLIPPLSSGKIVLAPYQISIRKPLGAKADSYASAKARKASYSSAKANKSFALAEAFPLRGGFLLQALKRILTLPLKLIYPFALKKFGPFGEICKASFPSSETFFVAKAILV
jgi:hypothetical protein